MFANIATAMIARLRAQPPRPHVMPGVYYLRGSNEWIYVPVSAEVVHGTPGLDGPRDSLRPHWRVRTWVVDASISRDDDAPIHPGLHAPEELQPASDLHVPVDLMERIARRVQRAVA